MSLRFAPALFAAFAFASPAFAQQLSIADASVTEGDAGTITLTFTVTASASDAADITFDVDTLGINATSGVDFLDAAPSGVILAGDASTTVEVTVIGDTVDEDDEIFEVTISNPSANATIPASGATAEGTILDDDVEPTVSINDASATEAGTLTFTVSLSEASGRDVTVSFATATGTAGASDFTATSGSRTITAGATSTTFTVTTTADALDEIDESLTVTLSSPVNATLADDTGAGTILDDDDAPDIDLADATIAEDGGSLSFNVALSAASGRTITVDFTTTAGTASTADFTSTTGTLTFAASDTTETITVPITDDPLDEDSETFTITLSSPSNVTLSDATAVITITDDNDTPPAIAAADQTFLEDDGTMLVLVTLDRASGRTVTVDFDTTELANEAELGEDFVDAAGTLIFAPGETEAVAEIDLIDDNVDEDAELVRFNLDAATGGASILDNRADLTIDDDEDAPTVSVALLSNATESATDPADDVVFQLTLSHPSAFNIDVDVDTRDGTALAGGNLDYDAENATIRFTPGQTTRTVAVDSNTDNLDEDDETLSLDLSNPTSGRATLGTATATGTIVDDDAAPTLAIADASLTEGDSGSANLTFTASLSGASGRTVTATVTAASDTATSGADFTATTVDLSFAPGATTQTFSVPVLGDLLDENSETFRVNLSAEVNATVTDRFAVGTINDNDPTPSVSIDNVSVTEGNAGTATLSFTVSLSAVSGRTVSVLATTSNGSAREPADYASRSATVTIPAGSPSGTFAVTVNGDGTFEGDDTVNVTLSAPSNATIGDGSGVGTIVNDDPIPTVSILDATLNAEGNAGTSNLRFTLELSNPSDSLVAVTVETADGTATQGSDYAPVAGGSAVIAAGQTSGTFDVVVGGDTIDEPDETFLLRIATATVTIGDNEAIGLIRDDDNSPTISIVSPGAVNEGNGTATLRFDVALSAVSGQEVRATLTRADVTATAGTDYSVAATQDVVFAPGTTVQPITVNVLPDALDEDDIETFTLTLSNIQNALGGTLVGTGQIRDDDDTPRLTVNDVILNPEETGADLQPATFTVTLSAPSGRAVRVTAATADGTATEPDDYQGLQQQLVFAPGDTTAQLVVGVVRDSAQEPDEQFFVELSAAQNALIDDDTGVGTILNDDAGPTTNTTNGQLDGPYQTTEEVALNVPANQGVLVNDEDVDNDPLVARVVDLPDASQGTLVLQDDGSFTFTPVDDFAGVATFTYVARDGTNESAPQEVRITVVNVNDAPEIDAAPVVITQTEDDTDPPGFDVSELVATDVITDVDASDLPGVAIVGLPAASTGSIELSLDDGATWTALTAASEGAAILVPATGLLRLVPNANETPTADVTVRAWDGSDGRAGGTTAAVTAGADAPFSATTGVLSFVVEPVNDAPVFVAPTPDAPVSAFEGVPLTISFLADDVDDAEADLDYTLGLGSNLPATAIFDADAREIRFTAAFTDAGTYLAELIVTDASGATDVREVTLNVLFGDQDVDGLPDTWEAQFGLDPADADSDGDLISDFDEAGELGPPSNLGEPVDTDGDNTVDALDPDSDDDGVLDSDEAGDVRLDTPPVTSDGDDTEDFRDDNADDDQHLDGADNCRTVANDGQEDLDSDFLGDACDADDDGDRLVDELEPGLLLDPRTPDEDEDGILDGDEVGDPQDAADSDGDGIIDAIEEDSDDDGILDADEAGDDLPQTIPVDTDGDGTPDFQDTDSDDDDISDDEDNCRITQNFDQTDIDADGVGDACLQVCGDGRVQAPEECDDGDNVPEVDQCTDTCKRIVAPEVCNSVDDDFDGRVDEVATEGGGFRSVCEEDLRLTGGGLGAACGCSSGVDLALPSFLGLLGFLAGRRHRRSRASGVAVVAAVVLAAAAGHAEGIQAQQFTPATGGASDLVLVEGTGVNGHLRPAGGLVLDYSYRTLVLQDDRTGANVALIDHRLNANLVASLSLFKVAQVGVVVPVTAFQKEGVDDIFVPTALSPVALGDVRVNGRFTVLDAPRGKSGFGLAVSTSLTAPTGSVEGLQGYGFLTVQPGVIAGWRFGERGEALANVGYLIRPRQALLGLEVGNEATFNIGGRFAAVPRVVDVIAEVNGRVAADLDIPINGSTTPVESLVAGRFHLAGGHAITAGAALGLTGGYGTPLFRAFAGYTFTLPGGDTDAVDPAVSDIDGDGTVDARDQCVDIAEDKDGIEDDDGCPDLDADNDGVPDNVDQCPEVAEDRDNFEDADGCADLDHDGDGLNNDAGDQCPDTPEDRDGFDDGDGCPDPDNDKDGVADADDKCPTTAGGAADSAASDRGCPPASGTSPTTATPDTAPIPLVSLDAQPPGPIELPQRIYFQVNGTDVTAEGRRLLDQVAATLKRNDRVRVEVQGHSDAQGGHDVNDTLSLRRAQAVIEILVKSGIPRQRFLISVLADSEPLAPNDTPQGRALNRRVQFRVLPP